jgi:uncharacterized SAM-binding protein YcdF (DUF218 family)
VVVRLLIKVVAGVAAMVLLLTYMMLVRPLPRDKVQRADAVVVLAGESSRLATGFRLVSEGKADVLVISNGTARGWRAANVLCAGTYTFEVICPKPSSDSTRGEARTIARLSRDNNWKRLVLVSSNFHVRRARTLFNRCFSGELRVYSSDPDRLAFGTWVGAILEWPKTAAAQVTRSC